MLTADDLRSFKGQTITDADTREDGGRTILRLRLQDGGFLAIEARGDVLNVADESSIPWGT